MIRAVLVGLLRAFAAACELVAGWVWAGIVTAALVHGCQVADQRDAALSTLDRTQAAHAAQEAEREALAAADLRQVKLMEEKHAAKQQEIVDAYRKKIADLERRPVAGGLRGAATAFASGDRREGESDTDACRRFRDRLRVVGGLLEEGIGLVEEGQGIVDRQVIQIDFLKSLDANDRTLVGE